MAVTESYVTAAKPNVSGAVSYCVAANATLPNNAYANLTNFTSLGYLTEDGITKSEKPSTDTVKAWGGDTVLVINSGEVVTFNFKCMEYMNDAVQSLIHGSDNVSGTLSTGLSITGGLSDTENAFVLDETLKGDVLHRFVIPVGVITDVGDINYKADGAVTYDVTITCIPQTSGEPYYEYMYSGTVSDASDDG